jgi:hypothetical protein
LQDLGVDERIILKCKKNRGGKSVLDSSGAGYKPVAGYYEHVNETSSSLKRGEFFY